MALRKGFLSTLEAVIASTIFLIFIINAAPTFTGATGQIDQETLNRIQDTVRSLDQAGKLRSNLTDRDLDSLEETLDPYVTPLEMAVGVLYSNATEYSYTGSGEQDFTFENSIGEEEQTKLRLWIDEADGLEIDLNDGTLIETDTAGYREIDITNETISGANSLIVTADSADLEMVLDQYRYEQSETLPTDTSIASTGYHVSGHDNDLSPTELRVFVWQ